MSDTDTKHRGRKRVAWLHVQNYNLLHTSNLHSTVTMTTSDEVNNKILYIKNDFGDIVSFGHLSVLISMTNVYAKLSGH